MKRIGLLGGSFDPVHLGHLHLAKTIYKALDLDEVWFLPAVKSPLKERELTDIRHRAAMIRSLIAPYRHFKLSMIEEKNTIPSYTINTARRLRRMYPDHQFYWLIGSDILNQLSHWKDIDELKTIFTFVCLRRNAEETSDEVLMIDGDIHPGNSTDIRNGDFRYLPDRLKRYIMDNGLYSDTIFRKGLSEKRIRHVLSVSELCVRMARGNNCSEEKARLAGLYHDCAKYMDREELAMYMKRYHPAEMEKYSEEVWHQYVGYDYMKNYYKMSDREILMAIKHHCLGLSREPLAMIVYCADKLDPLRGYDSSKTIELCVRDIRLGFEEVHRQQYEFLRKEGVI